MKAVVVITIALILTAGIAAHGPESVVQAATSVAFEHCVNRSDTCQPLLTPWLAQTEAELAALDGSAEGVGATVGAPEIGESRIWTFGIPGLARGLLDLFLSMIHRNGGNVRPGRVVVAETIFDPAR